MHDNTASKVLFILQEELESSLRLVHAVATGATGRCALLTGSGNCEHPCTLRGGILQELEQT